MKLKKRVISILTVIALLLTSIPLTLMPGSLEVKAASADNSLVLHRPTAGIYVNEVTRVAYANNSLRAPDDTNSVIVKATKSGTPYLTGQYAELAYAGETPYATQISFTPGVTPDAEPKITCSNTSVTFVSDTPAYSNGTYTWTVSGGSAKVGTTLIFTVSYSYSEKNEISGKTYTNTYETQCVSYVESIATPAGMYTTKRTYLNGVVYTDTKNRSYVATMVHGENTYGSVYNGGSGNGTINIGDSISWTSDFGVMKRFEGTSSAKNYNVAYSADSNRPLSTVYIDKSITSTLSALNLRIQTIAPDLAGNDNEKVTVTIAGSYIASGIVKTFSDEDSSSVPSNDATAASELGFVASTATIPYVTTSLDTSLQSYFEGVGPCKSTGTREYTVTLRYKTPADWTEVYMGNSVSFRFITYDKGSLRTLVEEIYGTDPTSMSINLPDGDFKGYNPQSWYYSSGWENFNNAYIAAKTVLAKPNVAQTDIDNAYTELQSAYAELQMKKADYTLADAYYKQAIAKNKSDYTLASWAKVQNILDVYSADYSVLYQPAVDKLAMDIKAAMDVLEYTTADYSEFNANLSTVNKLMSESETVYGKTADKVYNNWSNVISALKSAGCVYNELEGYSVGTYLDITQQSTVDGYTMLLKNAIDSLSLTSADYTAATAAENKYRALNITYIVDDVAEGLTSAYNALVAVHNLDISHQSEVDKATATLNYWLDNVEYKPADTTAAQAALAKANAVDRTQYSDLTDLDNAVKTLKSKLSLDIRYQSEIDSATKALESALANLPEKKADYSEVEKAIKEADAVAQNIVETYKDSYGFTAETFYSNWSEVTKAINNVDYNVVASKQAQVDAYAAAIRTALNNLTENKADYSAVTAAQQKAAPILENGSSLYTTESLNRLSTAYTAVVKNLDISKQAQVDAYAAAINEAYNKLEYLSANYSAVNAAKTAANEKLAANEAFAAEHPGYSLYTEASLNALNLAIASVVTGLDINEQEKVDAFAAAITDSTAKLEYAPADYTQVELAKDKIPSDLSLYTTLSVATLNSVLNKIDTTLTADKQSTVDGYVTSINNAVANLKPKSASYTALNAAIAQVRSEIDAGYYTEQTVTELNALIESFNMNLPLSEQATVDGYVDALASAEREYVGADYTEVEKAIKAAQEKIDSGLYTDESVKAVQTLIDSVAYGKPIMQQSEVDKYAEDIVKATNEMSKKLANYTELQKILDLLDNSDSEIYNNTYKNFDEVMSLISIYRSSTVSANMNLPIDEQSTVDEMTATLQSYLDMLEPAEEVKEIFEAKEGSTTVIKDGYIYGLSVAMSKAMFESSFVTFENVELSYSGNTGRYLGTGTVVTVKSSQTGETVGTYTIIIYGDIDGDGIVDAKDTIWLSNYLNKVYELNSVQKKAATIVSRTNVNVTDYVALTSVISNILVIDQQTGRAK